VATDPKPETQDPKETTETKGGVKSYTAPERTGPGTGRIVMFVVIAVIIALLLYWILV